MLETLLFEISQSRRLRHKIPLIAGQDMSLVLSISIAKTAFTNPNTSAPEPMSHLTAQALVGKKNFLDDLKETDRERLLRERKSALNKLFDKTNLQPVLDGMGNGREGTNQLGPTSSQSKRAMLEKMEKKKAGGVGEEEEEEDEMSEIQLNLVCASLPELLVVPLSALTNLLDLDRFKGDQERRESP